MTEDKIISTQAPDGDAVEEKSIEISYEGDSTVRLLEDIPECIHLDNPSLLPDDHLENCNKDGDYPVKKTLESVLSRSLVNGCSLEQITASSGGK